ncbi:ABC transporter ATP-binding protein [Roseomonas populi]|uniref:ABC transporter ATP-binding protein n=1 Tax=Roseomonas populi TaxID=3121582 RepID=A0ABT1WZI4_9PROT|nr:ABC transporter ATP-binding protein [Roseomonas pecuniae]MCR0981253.1 ABC transporter ATP-binding protein [Roseomonas pecuniae]
MSGFERPFVEIDDVSMRYGGAEGTLALRHTSMRIAKGEFVAVVGPSGCGKSTLMRLVTGLWPCSAGSVIVAGKEVAGPLSIAGMAFQAPTMLPWRTILQNVMLPLEVVEPHRRRLRGERSMYEEKARKLLALVGLAGFEDKTPHQLSGGMQQRASLCRALIHDPQLLMLDEPFGALDVFTREELWEQLAEVCRILKPTVILVTHDLKEAVFLADRVLIMSARPGRIIAERKVPFERPRNLDITYTQPFQELVHELREHISAARRGEEVPASPAQEAPHAA